MNIKLKRRYFCDKYTIGSLYINDKYFCDTLEDPNRDINKNGKFDNGETKIKGNTCIPFGKYKIIVNLSPKFKRELPRLLDVPSFEGVLIHRGNTAKDTEGCILVGENKIKGKVINSTIYEQKLVSLLKEIQSKSEQITIEIV